MALQVVTNENFQQLVETGKVDAFVPPAEPAKAEAKTETPAKEDATRGPDGKFTAAAEKVDSEAAKEVDKDHAAKTAGDDDDADLPEKVRQKIGKKHRAQKEAEEFAEQQYNERKAAERRAEKLERELEEVKAKSRPATAEEPKEPKLEDYATVGEFTKAAVAYGVQQELKREKAKAESQRVADEAAAAERAFGERVSAATQKYPDYKTVVASLAGTDADSLHADVLAHLTETENGAELTYHLAKNPGEIKRLQKLSPRKALAELGKLELKYLEPAAAAKEPVSIARTVSQAPAPITTIEAAKTVVQTDPAKMSFRELYEFRKQENAAKRR